MPGVSGFELIDRIRRLPIEHGGLTPAIAATAGSDSETEALMRGFHSWFSKPLDLLKVLDGVRSFAAAREEVDGISSARVTVTAPDASSVLITCVGHTRVQDMQLMLRALHAHLDQGPKRVVVDLRHNTGFDVAAPYVAQRRVWERRKSITSVHLIGGPARSQLVARAAAALLGVSCSSAGSAAG